MTDAVKENLTALRRLLENGWCQREFARNRAGEKVAWSSKDATCFCLVGGLLRVSRNSDSYGRCRDAVAGAIKKKYPARAELSISSFNDRAITIQADVLAVVDVAIAAQRG